MQGKPEAALELLDLLIVKFEEIGPIKLHATKSMLAIAADTSFAYVVRLGKQAVDLVFPFKTPQQHNLCFHKIAQVPGTQQYNHHLRLLLPEDLNDEVFDYMKKAYANGKNV